MMLLSYCKVMFCTVLMGCRAVLAAATGADAWLSPTALVATADSKTLYVACATANRVLCFDSTSRSVSASVPMPQSPSGLALSADQTQLFVTCAGPEMLRTFLTSYFRPKWPRRGFGRLAGLAS